MDVSQVLGPLGALVLALAVIGGTVQAIRILWAEHKKDDDATAAREERLWLVLEQLVPDVKKLAEAQLIDAQDKKGRQRRDDL